MQRIMKYFFYLVVTAVLILHCSKKDDKEKDKQLQALLLGWVVSQNVGDAYSRTFYMNPLFLTNKIYDLYLPIASSTNATSSTNKKLVLVHGWQSADKDINSMPDAGTLQRRLVENIWKDLFATNFLSLAISKGYDVYFYTYLTSESIEKNSTRFSNDLQSIFGSQTGNVAIIAHSMGGLVSRGALYNFSTTPGFLSRIFTLGTPYHGSPWASTQFQGSKGVLGDLATFMTNSTGGKDLGWDNYDNSLSGSSNTYLTAMNNKSGRDNLIYAYFGSLDKSASGYAGVDSTLTVGCSSLGDTFSPSDCIVPTRSAKGTGLQFGKTQNLGAYQHTDLNLRIDFIRTTIYNELP